MEHRRVLNIAKDEKTLARLLSLGMLFLAIFVTLGLGGFLTYSRIQSLQIGMTDLADEQIEQAQLRLNDEFNTVLSKMEFQRLSATMLLEAELREKTDMAWQILEGLYQKHHTTMSESDLQILMRDTLRPIRFFGGRGHFTIRDKNGYGILFPATPDQEGAFLWDQKDGQGRFLTRDIIGSVANGFKKGMISNFQQKSTEDGGLQQKLTYSRMFEPFDWVIGTSDYLAEKEETIKNSMLQWLEGRRFDRDGYFAVLSQAGTYILSQGKERYEGTNKALLDGEGRRLMEQILSAASEKQDFIFYDWYRPGGLEKTRKMSRVLSYEPWGWIMVAGVYLDDLDLELQLQRARLEAEVRSQVLTILIVMIVAVILSLSISLYFGRWMGRHFHFFRTDLAEKSARLEQQSRELSLSAQVFESSSEAILITDADNNILMINKAYTDITGYRFEDVVGKNPAAFGSDYQDSEFYAQMWNSIKSKGMWSGEIWNKRKNGKVFPEWLSISVVRDDRGAITHYIGTFTDMTNRKESEHRIQELAYYDPLTHLPNRRLLKDRLEQVISSCKQQHYSAALVFIDLDAFKILNDTRGHDVGDMLLIKVGERLHNVIRTHDTVARLGGDEFVVILTELTVDHRQAALDVEFITEKIRESLSESYDLNGRSYLGTASLGVVLVDKQDITVEEYLRRADAAMYQAKHAGRDSVCFYDPALQHDLMLRTGMETELREAIPKGELVLYYQPQYDGHGKVTGAEALIRWNHPERGMIGPGVFVPLAEETGLIISLGQWVMDAALETLSRWQANDDLRHLELAINVSAHQLEQDDFVHQVTSRLEAYELDTKGLKIELTESAMLENVEGSVEKMRELRHKGIRFSMDDFGTGHSSLTYLRRLPLDQVKIDQSFVYELPRDRNAAVIVKTIIAMSESLGLSVIAEGVETIEQRTFLEEAGCCCYQGYYYGRPMPLSEFERKVHEVVP